MGFAASAPPLPIKSVTVSRPDFVLDHTLKGHSGWVTGVAFSSDGRRLASGSWDQTVKFWDVPTGQELSTVGSEMKEVQGGGFQSRRTLVRGGEFERHGNIVGRHDRARNPHAPH